MSCEVQRSAAEHARRYVEADDLRELATQATDMDNAAAPIGEHERGSFTGAGLQDFGAAEMKLMAERHARTDVVAQLRRCHERQDESVPGVCGLPRDS